MKQAAEDYLGWSQAPFVALGLLMVWFTIIGAIQYSRKKKDRATFLKKKWWFWTISCLLLFHYIFIQFINPTFMGFGTPEEFSEVYIIDDKVVLFDNRVTYHDDEITGTDDYTGHLRIHLIDRNKHTKLYSELIGSNYSTFIEDNEIYLISNSRYSHGVQKNVIYSISHFDYNTKKKTVIVEADEIVEVNGKEYKVYEIDYSNAMFFKTAQGEVFQYNTTSKEFEFYDGVVEYSTEENKAANFYLRPTKNGPDRKELFVENQTLNQIFLLGEINRTYYFEGASYCLVRYFKTVEREDDGYAFLNASGEVLWEIELEQFKEVLKDGSLKNIQHIVFHEELVYLAVDEYLIEMDLLTGVINWWIKV